MLVRSLSTPFSSLVNLNNNEIHSAKKIKPNFDQCRPYKDKKVSDLLRSLLVFQLCGFKPLVLNGTRLLDLSRRLLGDKITDTVIQETFFKQFCGGQRHDEVVEKVHELKMANIGAILDYAAENEEKSPSSSPSANRNQPAKVYDYHSEALCDDHVSSFIQCIKTVRDSGSSCNDSNQFAAIKVSALGNPMLLQRISDFACQTQVLMTSFDEAGKGYITREEFERMHRSLSNDNHQLNELIDRLDPKGMDVIDHTDWCTTAFTRAPELCLPMPSIEQFTSEEFDLIQAMQNRAGNIAEEAFLSDVRLLIDAEQSWIQPAIDVISQGLQQSYNDVNKIDHPIIFNTYQCYLKKALGQIKIDLTRAKRLGYHLGPKLVRGAYMQRERERADEMGYASPIQDTAQDTHDSYNAAVQNVLHEILDLRASSSPLSLEVMCATHNRQSIEWTIKLMEDLGLGPAVDDEKNHNMISFSQLYGMSDEISIPLAENGYNVYKYVPFGAIREVIPYMLRRAQENSDILGKSQYEIELILDELKQRILWK